MSYQDRCCRGHPFDETNTYVCPRGWKVCRICRRERNRKHRENRAQGLDPIRDGYRIARNGLTWEIVDMLMIEGGWWTCDGIALRLGAKLGSVRRIVVRLRQAGLLESRRVDLALRETGYPDTRFEWRAIS